MSELKLELVKILKAAKKTPSKQSLIKEYDWRCKSPHIRPLGWKRKWILEQFQALEAEVEGMKKDKEELIRLLVTEGWNEPELKKRCKEVGKK